MKKTFFVFTLILFLHSTSAFSQADSSFTLDINTGDDINEYFFEIYYYDGSDEIGSIKYWPGKPDRVNVIVLHEDDYAHYIKFDDYNFDGYLDMYVHDPCMILGNCHGRVYLFNSRLVEYKHDPRFDDMTTIVADPEAKTIFSSNRSSGGSIFTNETFEWEGDELVLIKRVSQGFAPGDDGKVYLHKTEERDENGLLKVIEEKYLKEPLLH